MRKVWNRGRRAALLGAAVLACAPAVGIASGRVLDDFADLSPWRAVASEGTEARIAALPAGDVAGLRLTFDFRGTAGYAVARRELPLTLPESFEISFRMRGKAPVNDFQFKLVDASGDNVWWFRRPDHEFSGEWERLHIRRSDLEFAWGPIADRRLLAAASLEFAVTAGRGGGAGHVDIAELAIRDLPPDRAPVPTVPAASSTAAGFDAAYAVDGDPATHWRSAGKPEAGVVLAFEFGDLRELGGLTLAWTDGEEASDYDIELIGDSSAPTSVRRIRRAAGGTRSVLLPGARARALRLRLLDGPGPSFALAECVIEPPSFAASANELLYRTARRAARGQFPRAFVGEQTYWTIVGTDGGSEEGLLSEDGAFELRRGGPSLEPFVAVDGIPFSWAQVELRQSLKDGYLPLPSVHWKTRVFELDVSALAAQVDGAEFAVIRYEFRNTTARQQSLELAAALRPLQVNPPTQFLNRPGGAASLRSLAWDGRQLRIDGEPGLVALEAPDRYVAAPFDTADTPERLMREPDAVSAVTDEAGLASAALIYRRMVPPFAATTIAFLVPWDGRVPEFGAGSDMMRGVARLEARVARGWQRTLNRVSLSVPVQARAVTDTVRTALAHILINRDGPSLRPGSRSYERSWIRDGAMTSEALLRLGHAEPVAGFLHWYAGYQFDSGRIPCCVDGRGADPVPENDSNGQFVWLADQYQRYTGDTESTRLIWPRIEAALGSLDDMRESERTADNRSEGKRAFYGLLPASISHEGYSAKPMHSYWDNFWALAGYGSGIRLAELLRRPASVARWSDSRDAFRADVIASIGRTVAQHRIDYLPGCAELGDFDPTSTTILLAPVGESGRLPAQLVRNTFERYWHEFVTRRSGDAESREYTPYEIRTVGTFVRLGWPGRAGELLQFFMGDRRPAAWNQWAEVVGLDAREPRFIGDMPHGWVAGDFIRSVLDLFAYERSEDESLVLAAGIDPSWLEGDGIAVSGLHTPWGRLSYSLRRVGDARLRLRVEGGVRPPGGIVLSTDGVERRFRGASLDVTLETPRAR